MKRLLLAAGLALAACGPNPQALIAAGDYYGACEHFAKDGADDYDAQRSMSEAMAPTLVAPVRLQRLDAAQVKARFGLPSALVRKPGASFASVWLFEAEAQTLPPESVLTFGDHSIAEGCEQTWIEVNALSEAEVVGMVPEPIFTPGQRPALYTAIEPPNAIGKGVSLGEIGLGLITGGVSAMGRRTNRRRRLTRKEKAEWRLRQEAKVEASKQAIAAFDAQQAQAQAAHAAAVKQVREHRSALHRAFAGECTGPAEATAEGMQVRPGGRCVRAYLGVSRSRPKPCKDAKAQLHINATLQLSHGPRTCADGQSRFINFEGNVNEGVTALFAPGPASLVGLGR